MGRRSRTRGEAKRRTIDFSRSGPIGSGRKTHKKMKNAPSLKQTGLATVLSLLGLSATFAGKVMGSAGALGSGIGATVLPLAASAFAVMMGLNVLELVKLDLPSFEGGLDYMTSLPKNARAYLLGGISSAAGGGCRGWR